MFCSCIRNRNVLTLKEWYDVDITYLFFMYNSVVLKEQMSKILRYA